MSSNSKTYSTSESTKSRLGLTTVLARLNSQELNFAETDAYPHSKRVRLIWPMKNHARHMPEILEELNELTRKAFLGKALGVEFIAQQLKQTKLLDLYVENQTGKLCQYTRLDVYENVPGRPVSMGIFKVPGYVCELRNSFGNTLLRELSDRRTNDDSNPSLIHVNCAFSPRGYEICQAIADRMIPDIGLIYRAVEECVNTRKNKLTKEQREQFEKSVDSTSLLQGLKIRSFSKMIDRENKDTTSSVFSPLSRYVYESICESVSGQIAREASSNPDIREITKAYIRKMKHCTGLELPFIQSKSVLKGCIPVPKNLMSSINARDKRITDFFHAYLDIPRGDMFLFYSEISYQSLRKKVKNDS